jgi:methyltransferase (TIGR00027 family)
MMHRRSPIEKLRPVLTIGLLLSFASGGGAVEPGLPSKTSILIAAMRALASHDPDPLVRNPDWLADQFIGPRERRMIQEHWAAQALNAMYVDALKLGAVGPVSRAALIRTRFIDESLERAVRSGAKQIVILGAGFDSRAYRQRALLAGTRVFEVDYGPTQEYKKQRVRDVLGGFPPNVVFAPIDFRKDKLSAVLHKSGYRDSVPALVIWEGVTFYISEDAVRQTLRTLADLAAPGSVLVTDYMTKSYVEGEPGNPRKTQAGFPQWGEPWIFGIADGTEATFFGEGGFHLDKEVSLAGSDAEVAKLYLTRRDGTIYAGPVTNSGAFFSSPGRAGYWIAELTVAKREGHAR